MIPYVELPPLRVFGLELHAFGALAALGIYVGLRIAARIGRNEGPKVAQLLADIAPFALVGGLVGGHLLHVLGYHPEILARDGPLVLLKVWDGLSSMGGVVGGLLATLVYLRVRRERFLPLANPLALGIAPGWAIARLGCFAAHDHPGVLTDFPLAVAFPNGARHDLGLYDFFVLAALSIVLHLLARRRRPAGFLLGVLAIGYAVARFFLDFLRATDLAFVDGRILGLTPAQYVSVALVVVGGVLLARSRAAGVEGGAPSRDGAAESRPHAA